MGHTAVCKPVVECIPDLNHSGAHSHVTQGGILERQLSGGGLVRRRALHSGYRMVPPVGSRHL